MDGYMNQRVIHGHTSEDDLVRYYNGSKLVLNLHRLNSDLDMANSRKLVPKSLNNRFYEAAACGKNQLVTGRGVEWMHNPYTDGFNPEEHSYKRRLVDFYTNLLK